MNKRLFTILMIVFVQMVGASMVFPILPLYARESFDISDTVVTLLISSYFAAQFIGAPIMGRLSDRYGRVPVLIVSQIGTAISFLMLAFAGNVEVMFISRILDGITGGNVIVAQAYITDIMPREKRTQALGIIYAAFGIGFIVGPASGGILAAFFGARIPFVIASIAATLIVILTRVTLTETLSPEQRAENRQSKRGGLTPRQMMQNMPLVSILIVAFVGQLGFGFLQGTFALYGQDVLFKSWESNQVNLGIGLLLALIGVGQFITQFAILPKLTARLGDPKAMAVGIALRGLAMFMYAILVSPWLAAINGFIFAIGMGVMTPTSQSVTTLTVDDNMRGGVLGVYQSAISLATICGTAVSGSLYDVNPRAPYFVGGVLFMLSLLLAMPVIQRYTQEEESNKRSVVLESS